MLGAIAGDIIGSVFERRPCKSTDFPLFPPFARFTDDTVLSVAVAEAILRDRPYGECLRDWARRYPEAGYGHKFLAWAMADAAPAYQSMGNGSAMRVGPVGFAFDDVGRVLAEARQSALPSHDHPAGVKGAQAVAAAVFLARTGTDKAGIQSYVEQNFGYGLSLTVDELRPTYGFDVTCPGSVPEALRCFLEADDFERAVRLAVSLGGDADTQACIAGAVAEAFFGEVPTHVRARCLALLDEPLRAVVLEFEDRFPARRKIP